jgi:hypothetical protein
MITESLNPPSEAIDKMGALTFIEVMGPPNSRYGSWRESMWKALTTIEWATAMMTRFLALST